jgi:hypothetical protein
MNMDLITMVNSTKIYELCQKTNICGFLQNETQ